MHWEIEQSSWRRAYPVMCGGMENGIVFVLEFHPVPLKTGRIPGRETGFAATATFDFAALSPITIPHQKYSNSSHTFRAKPQINKCLV